MERRRFLATTGIALLGGCTFGATGDTPTSTPLDPPTDTPGTPTDGPDPSGDPELTQADLRDRRVVDFETAPLTVALYGRRRINGRVTTTYGISEPATADTPAVVHALLENRGTFEQTFNLRRIPGFDDPPRVRASGDRAADTDRADVYLAPTEDHDLVQHVPDIQQDDNDRWRLTEDASREWLPKQLTLAPEEAVLGAYYLVGRGAPTASPLVVGEYRGHYQGGGFTISVWNTEAPGPEGPSVHDGASVPPLPNDNEMAWFHEADTSTEVYLESSVETIEAPACIEYELHNHSHEWLGGNPYRWGLYKLDGNEWFRIEPWAVPVPAARIPPGDSDESELSLFHGDPFDCEDGRGVGHLGGGRYAYHVGFNRDGETHAALVDLEAPAVEPEPDDDVEVARDGGTVVVTMPAWHDDEHPPRAEIEFARAGAKAAAERRIIPEQLFRRSMTPYRNALLHFRAGVERVVLRADRHAIGDTVGYDALETTVAYEGETFQVESEDPLKE